MSQIVNNIRAARGQNSRIIFGALHLPGLPGSPSWYRNQRPSLSRLSDQLLKRAEAFANAGFDGFILENFGDAPFFAESVPAVTVAAMSVLAGKLRTEFEQPIGINVLRNDGESALAIALASQSQFIRVNVLNSTAVTDQGLISGRAAELLRQRAQLDCDLDSANCVEIWADVHVKHARPLGELDLAVATKDLVLRSGADCVIVSGKQTGSAPENQAIQTVNKAAAGKAPVIIGSGLSQSNLSEALQHCDGAVVASAVLQGGCAGAEVDPEAAMAFIKAVREFERHYAAN